MKEIGELLQEARMEKGISLEQISKETKIPERVLRNLEEGDFSGFAGKVYLKGALRNYAESVGIDSGELFALYDRIIDKKDSKSGEMANDRNMEKEPEGKIIFAKKTRKPIPFVVLIWVAVLVFVVGGSIWYRSEQQNNEEKASYPEEFLPDDLEEDTEEIILDNSNDEETDQPAEVEAEPVLTLLEEGGREATYLLKQAETKEIVLQFTADCWISIEQDGRFIEQKIYGRGDERRIGDGDETMIRFGNPPVALIKVNGQEISLSDITNPYNITIRKE